MNLLLARNQSSAAMFSLIPLRIGNGVTFSLHATLELDQEERALLERYNFRKAALVVSDPIDDLKQSLRPALVLGVVSFLVLSLFASFSFAATIGILVTLGMTGVYFKTLREQIIVRELLDGGRTFRCDSIVDLIKKEAYLNHICAHLRQILESAKQWHDREVVPIQPLQKEEAKLAVLKAAS